MKSTNHCVCAWLIQRGALESFRRWKVLPGGTVGKGISSLFFRFSCFGEKNCRLLLQLKGVLQIQATDAAFAAILGDESVIAWGSADYGGDSLAVRDQLKGVQQIQATRFAKGTRMLSACRCAS